MRKSNHSVYGTFKVTTEGDAEGRSARNLGIYRGFIDEIAFALADKCYYSLSFSPVVVEELDTTPTRDTVNISLELDNDLFSMNLTETKSFFQEFFKDRDVEVVEACGYGQCIISTHKETVEEKKAKILSKLTEEERKILGV